MSQQPETPPQKVVRRFNAIQATLGTLQSQVADLGEAVATILAVKELPKEKPKKDQKMLTEKQAPEPAAKVETRSLKKKT